MPPSPSTEAGGGAVPGFRTETVNRLSWPSLRERDHWLQLPVSEAVHHRLLAEIPALAAIEARLPPDPAPPPERARIVFWNVERLRFGPEIAAVLSARAPDACLLAEVDVGMARSGNRHTVAELAGMLRHGYLFGVEFVELGLGSEEERRRCAGDSNLAGLHGNAILSPHVLTRLALLRLDEEGRWFDGAWGERRIGGRMALFAQLPLAAGPVTLVCTHLESHTDPEDRCRQMARLLDGVERYDPRAPVLIGGDFNTSTLSRLQKLAPQLLSRLVGDRPRRLLDPVPFEPLFELARARGYEWRCCNTEGVPTQRFPDDSPEPRGRIDWFFARGLRCSEPETIAAVDAEGRMISDHDAIAVTIRPR